MNMCARLAKGKFGEFYANLANSSTRAKLAVFRNVRDSPDSPTFAKPCCTDSPDSPTFAMPCCTDLPDLQKASLVSFMRI